MTTTAPAPKRPRTTTDLVATHPQQQQEESSPFIRTSSLPYPTLCLTGHSGSVYALAYSPQALATASFDKTILLWNHHHMQEELEPYCNYNTLRGHKNAVLDVHWCGQERLVSCGADKVGRNDDILDKTRTHSLTAHLYRLSNTGML